MIIAGFAGVGKSQFSKIFPEILLDLDSSDFKWHYSSELLKLSVEERKGQFRNGKTVNQEYPENYINAIRKALCEEKIPIVSCQSFNEDHMKKLKTVCQNEVLILVYPEDNHDIKIEYCNRFVKRGNRTEFIDQVRKKWSSDISNCKNNKIADIHVVLGKDQTLADCFSEFIDRVKVIRD